MLITFSETFLVDHAFPEDWVKCTAQNAGCYARVKWATDAGEARFTLVERAHGYTPATTAQHESVILALLELDPRATIRTSRARYVGLVDYVRQNAGKLAFHHVDGDQRNNAIENLRVVQTRERA